MVNEIIKAVGIKTLSSLKGQNALLYLEEMGCVGVEPGSADLPFDFITAREKRA